LIFLKRCDIITTKDKNISQKKGIKNENKEKISLIHVAKLTDIVEGILWLIFGICNIIKVRMAGSIVLVIVFFIGLLLLILKNIYLKLKEKDIDMVDEMAKEHRRDAVEGSGKIMMMLLLITALVASIVNLILGAPVKISIFSGMAFVYGMFTLIRGIIFIRLEKRAA